MEYHNLIREKYGLKRGMKNHQVVNRAVREEIPGGEGTLEALAHFQKLLNSLKSERRENVANIRQMIDIVGVALDRLNEIADEMRADAKQRYRLQWRTGKGWEKTHTVEGEDVMRVDGVFYTRQQWSEHP